LKLEVPSGASNSKRELAETYRSIYSVEDKIEESNLITWLGSHKPRIIKRQGETFFLSDKSIFTYDFENMSQKDKAVDFGDKIKVQWLS
jgi:hypothetical protein